MTQANRPRSLPSWVTWFTTAETTRTGFRWDAWFHLWGGFVLSGIGALASYFGWFPWWLVLLPAAWIVVGLWMFAAGAWLDRNEAWQLVSSQPGRRHLAPRHLNRGPDLDQSVLVRDLDRRAGIPWAAPGQRYHRHPEAASRIRPRSVPISSCLQKPRRPVRKTQGCSNPEAACAECSDRPSSFAIPPAAWP